MTGQRYNSGTDDGSSFRVERRELKNLLRLVRAGQSVLITGGRKFGKTVLLQQVRQHLQLQAGSESPLFLPFYLDLMSLTRPPTAARLFSALSHKVPPAVDALLNQRGVNAKCHPAPDTWRSDPSHEFIRYLNDVLNHLDDTVGRVIFIYLLDECEALLGAEETHTLLGNLRAVVGPETDNRIKLVVAGFRDTKDYEDPITGTSPFKNVLIPLPLSLFQEAEFNELIRPFIASLPEDYRETLRKMVWEATGGHPCLVQVICDLLMTEFSPQEFKAASAKAIKLLQGMAFGSWVGRFTSVDHDLFRNVLADRDTNNANPLSIEFLQYCGVLTSYGEKLLAPCGLFNEWYKHQFSLSETRQELTHLSEPSRRGDSSRQNTTLVGENLSNSAITAEDQVKTPCALIMKGGGVKGLALVGALLELEKYYEFTAYVGTSAGAIVAGLLAAGCSPQQLESILRRTDFRRFQDGRWYLWLKNFLRHLYIHPGREFEKWLWEQVKEYNKRTWQLKAPKLRDLDRHLTIYATQEGEGTIVFDSVSDEGNKTTPLTFAIRCSMSIPVFFKPPMHDGKPVYDGGLLENFPAERWLRDNPGHDFISIYLGPKVLDPTGSSSTIAQVSGIVIDRNDATFIDANRSRVVVVDPEPVSTTDFDLSPSEAEFLVLQGRADALEHLYHFLPEHRRPSDDDVKTTKDKADAAKLKALAARWRRKRIRLAKRIAVIVIASTLLIFITIRFGIPIIRSMLTPPGDRQRDLASLERIYIEATEYDQKRDKTSIENAIARYDRLIAEDYKVVSVFHNRGYARERLGYFEDCEGNYRKAIADYTYAITNLEMAGDSDDDRSSKPGLYLARGLAKARAGNLQAALEDLNRVCSEGAKPEQCREATNKIQELNLAIQKPAVATEQQCEELAP